MKKGWQVKKLGEICAFEKVQGIHRDLPYVGLEQIESHTARFVGSMEPQPVKSSTFRFSDEHVLYGRLRPYLNKALAPDFEGHCSTEIFPLKPGRELSREYLLYWLLADETCEHINATCTGARMPRAQMNEVMGFDFPLPPLAEQQRIVGLLDEAFAGLATAKANAEKNLQNARALFESHLQSVFTQRGEGWQEKPLDQVSSILNGYAFKSTDFSADVGAKSIKITNVGIREFVSDTGSYLPASFLEEYKAVSVKAGSIVIALTRTIISGGLKVAIVPTEYDGALLNQRVAAIQSNDSVLISPFLYAYLSTQTVSRYVTARVNTLMQPNLSIADLRAMPVPIPLRAEQEKIVAELSSLTSETQRLTRIYEQKLAALNELKKSLLHEAFTGNL